MVFSLWKQQLSCSGDRKLLSFHVVHIDLLDQVEVHIYPAHFAFCFLISIPSSLLRNFVYSSFRVMVLKLVASCHWGYGLGKLSTILEMQTLRRQPYTQLSSQLQYKTMFYIYVIHVAQFSFTTHPRPHRVFSIPEISLVPQKDFSPSQSSRYVN
jgi:hypothetical protein